MRAAVLRAFDRDLKVEDVTIQPPRDREVLVRIMATGICASDLSTIRGKTGAELPLVPGHEAAGLVERVGVGVSRVAPGNRVVLSWAPNCGHCFYCHQSHPTLCDVYGEAAGRGLLWDGSSRLSNKGEELRHYSCVSSFAEYAVVPESGCIVLPPDVPFAVAALVGCAVTTGFGAVVNDAAVRVGDRVAVVGVGGVGVNALLAAHLAGADVIVAVDADPKKRDIALANHATHFVDARDDDAVDQVKSLTGGRGVDQAIESTGQPEAMALAYRLTRAAGSVVIVGIARAGLDITIPAIGFPGSKKRLIGSIYGGGIPERDMHHIFSLYRSGRLDLDAQIGRRIGLERVNEGLRWLEQGVSGRTIIEFDT